MQAFSNSSKQIQELDFKQLTSLLSGSVSAKNSILAFSPADIKMIYFTLKSSFTFAFSMGMISAAILVMLTFSASFLLPNKPVYLP